MTLSLRSTNLNLIPVLRALLKEGGVSSAAKSVGLSQPATSNALTRLRVLLKDPLLFRVGQTMHLTPKAKRLLETLDDVCRALEEILAEPNFDPRQTDRAFVVAASDYQAYLIGDYLADRLPTAAPNISIRFIEMPQPARRVMESGDIDLRIVRWVEGIDEGLSFKAGYDDRMIGMVRRGHPLSQMTSPRSGDLQAYNQVRQQRQSMPGPKTASWPNLGGNISITLTHFMSLAMLVRRSDSFTVMPKSIADHLKTILMLDTFELPSAAASPFELCMIWGRLNDDDPPHRWFRGLIDGALKETMPQTNAAKTLLAAPQ